MVQTCTHNMSDSVPWHEVFPEYSDEDLPGVCLRGSRYKEGLTQKQLADMIGMGIETGGPAHEIDRDDS